MPQVGLNAGSNNKAASAYYLHLHRVVRALRLIQSCRQPDGSWVQPCIPRGDLQATFVFKGYDEVGWPGISAAVRGGREVAAGVTCLAYCTGRYYAPSMCCAAVTKCLMNAPSLALQVVLPLTPFHVAPSLQVRRLGLRKETEEAVRACKQLEAGSASELSCACVTLQGCPCPAPLH